MAGLKTIRPGIKPMKVGLQVSRSSDAGQRFYSTPEWRAVRDHVLKVRGRRCQRCGRSDTRVLCDHVEELRDGGAPLDESNLIVLCGSCHSQKTADARARRMGLR